MTIRKLLLASTASTGYQGGIINDAVKQYIAVVASFGSSSTA